MPATEISRRVHTQSRSFRPYAVSTSLLVVTALLLSLSMGFPPAAPTCLAADDAGAKAKSSSPQKSDPSVTVYVTSWCPACAMAISYLKQKNIPFTVKDIEKNPDYLKEMVGKVGGYRGVPVLDVNGKTYLGFHPSIVDDLAK